METKQETSTGIPALQHLLTGARWMLLIYLGIGVVIFTVLTVQSLAYPYPLDYGEGPLLDQALKLSQGQNIYANAIDAPPNTVTNYTPLYMLLWAGLTAIFGPAYIWGRLISVTSTLVAAFYVYKLVFCFTSSRISAIISAGMFLNLPYVLQWASLARVDTLALALSLAALYALTATPFTGKSLVVSALLLTASVYTRQSYAFAAPLAAFVYLLFHDRKQAFRLAVLVLSLGFSLYGLLTLLTGGGFHFSIYTITVGINTYDIRTLSRYAGEILRNFPVLLVVLAGFFILGFLNLPGWKLAAPYALAAGIISTTIAKEGSNVNYLLEFCAALSLAVGLVLSWNGRIHNQKKDNREKTTNAHLPWWSYAITTVITLAIAVQSGFILRFNLGEQVPVRNFRMTERADLDYLYWQIEQSDAPLLSDEYMGLQPLMGRSIDLQNFELRKLANAGVWDQTPVVESITAAEYPFIHVNRWERWDGYLCRWTPEMFEAIQQSYIATDQLGNSIIFEPYSRADFGPRYPDDCPSAPWSLPTDATFGLMWYNRTLTFNGMGETGTIPVFAVADGTLVRPQSWHHAVAIRHVDPLNSDTYVWTYYSGMALDENTSYITDAFPTGSEVTVKQGDFLGYQGSWQYGEVPVHLRFAVLPEVEPETFPLFLIDVTQPRPALADDVHFLNPESYIGIAGSQVMGEGEWIPAQCAQP